MSQRRETPFFEELKDESPFITLLVIAETLHDPDHLEFGHRIKVRVRVRVRVKITWSFVIGSPICVSVNKT